MKPEPFGRNENLRVGGGYFLASPPPNQKEDRVVWIGRLRDNGGEAIPVEAWPHRAGVDCPCNPTVSAEEDGGLFIVHQVMIKDGGEEPTEQ